MIKNDKTKGFILVILAALLWGYLGIPTKNLYDFNFDSFSVCFFRTSIAGIFYFLYCFKKDANLLKIDKKGLLFFILYGAIGFATTFICYNVSVNYTSIALGTMFMFTSQVWVVILSYFIFKEKFTSKKIIAIFLTLAGCFMMCKMHDPKNLNLNLKGVILGLISGITFALQIIFAKISSKKYSQNTLLAYSFIFASLFLIPFMDAKSTLNILSDTNNLYPIIQNIFVIGFFTTVIANGAYLKSVEHIEVGIASIIATLEIPIAAIIAYFVFHQTLDIIQIIGMFLIIISVIILELKIKNLSEVFNFSLSEKETYK
ncbi:DMT family transporter [Clostridium tetani]|uniref:DMT family transporter n=1 Tax=Clostridium tetani TaxID=1513 RepID=UPI000514653F|nr:DMT family transporter [Clostridium tetani]KGI43938.1 transporter [Clostridium tetani]RXI68681.1 EamA family transporter [Clostridium tetani]BDR75714.1 transporter [Clostridium tetani]BDR86830.1 transporter [Clostridium tetani]